MTEQLFSVKSTCQLTGLNEHTLRAWERRHGAVAPQRTPNGQRMYTAADVERLRRMVQLVEKGLTIGRVAGLSDAELAQHLSRAQELEQQQQAAARSAAAVRRRAALDAAVAATFTALRRYDLPAIHQELARARARFGARAFALDFVSPLMGQVGRMILEGRFSIGQEHALTAIVKAHLSSMLFDLGRGQDGPAFAMATMEGDLHEIGILISAVLCADRGVVAHYIGPNMPAGALGEAAAALRVDRILIGVAARMPGLQLQTPEAFLEQLAPAMPDGCEVWFGGDVDLASKPSGVRVVRTLADFDALLDDQRATEGAR